MSYQFPASRRLQASAAGSAGFHAAHRLICFSLFIFFFALVAIGRKNPERLLQWGVYAAGTFVMGQMILGVANVAFQVPVPLAAVHPGVAEFLLAMLGGLILLNWIKKSGPLAAGSPIA